MSPDRRAFVRRAFLLGLAAPVAAWGCRPENPQDEAQGAPEVPAATADRPVIRAWSDDAVHLPAPLAHRPVAYLSAQERKLYIERGHRSRVERLLGAYISITTGLWRIHLLGDDTRIPVHPGDEDREFEELDLTAWDPTAPPSVGDIRIALGTLTTAEVTLACTPVLGGGGWVTAPPFLTEGVAGVGEGEVRQHFGQVATARRHAGRACDSAGEPVRVLSWGTRERISVSRGPSG